MCPRLLRRILGRNRIPVLSGTKSRRLNVETELIYEKHQRSYDLANGFFLFVGYRAGSGWGRLRRGVLRIPRPQRQVGYLEQRTSSGQQDPKERNTF